MVRKRTDKVLRCISFLTLICLCFQTFAPLTSAESTKETLYISVFLSDLGEIRLVRNVHLIFENISGPPIDTSLPAFSKLNKLEFALTPQVDKFFITFNIFFDSTISNETARNYSDIIIDQFLRVFNYQGLKLLWKSQGIWKSEMVVHKSFGYMPYTKEKVSTFFKFKPLEGFAVFIDSLLSKYVPGNATTGLSASYWLTRTKSDFQWTLKVTGVTSSLVPWYPHDYLVTISANDLLNDDLSKIKVSKGRVVVLIETNKTLKLTKGLTTYTITLQDVEPKGYTISPSSYFEHGVDLTYQLPLENIIIKLSIDSSVEHQAPANWLHQPLLYLAVSLFAFLVAYLVVRFLKKKRKDLLNDDLSSRG